MRWEKRLFDLFCASVLLVVLMPLMIYLAYRIKRDDPGPALYISARMKTPSKSFGLVKFRTMRLVAEDENSGVTGPHKDRRITDFGSKLRAKRLDELPQLWNIVKGDMSFVGPRPPLPEYVARYPEIYTDVLQAKPGVTGLASLKFHKREETLLSACKTASETDEVYARRCIPAKAKLDLIYLKNYSPCFDYKIIHDTLRNAFR